MSTKGKKSSRPAELRATARPASRASLREWGLRLALVVFSPVLLLAVADLGLRLARYGYPTSFLLKDPVTGAFHSNDKFVWQFYSPATSLTPQPFVVAAKKPPGTIRIVVLGESAAAGTPDPTCSFGRILERVLRHQYPGGSQRRSTCHCHLPGRHPGGA